MRNPKKEYKKELGMDTSYLLVQKTPYVNKNVTVNAAAAIIKIIILLYLQFLLYLLTYIDSINRFFLRPGFIN